MWDSIIFYGWRSCLCTKRSKFFNQVHNSWGSLKKTQEVRPWTVKGDKLHEFDQWATSRKIHHYYYVIVGNYEPLDLVKLVTMSLEYLTTHHQMGLQPTMHQIGLEIVDQSHLLFVDGWLRNPIITLSRKMHMRGYSSRILRTWTREDVTSFT